MDYSTCIYYLNLVSDNIYQKLTAGRSGFAQIDVILDVRKPLDCCTKCSKKSLCVLVQYNDVSKTCTLHRIDVTNPNIINCTSEKCFILKTLY